MSRDKLLARQLARALEAAERSAAWYQDALESLRKVRKIIEAGETSPALREMARIIDDALVLEAPLRKTA